MINIDLLTYTDYLDNKDGTHTVFMRNMNGEVSVKIPSCKISDSELMKTLHDKMFDIIWHQKAPN